MTQPTDSPPQIIPFQASPPSASALARGLQAARAIEHTTGLVRKARSHLGKAPPPKLEWPHHRARRQLRKLLRALEGLQRQVLSEGLGADRLAELQHRLELLDGHLGIALEQPLDRASLTALRKLTRAARRELAPREGGR